MKYLIGLIALALPTYLIRFNILGVPTTLLEIIIYLVFIYGIINIAYCQWLEVRRRVWLPVAILLLGLVLATYIAPDKFEAIGQVKAFFIDPLMVFLLMICYLHAKDFIWILYGLAGSGLVVSIHAIFQKILGHVTSDGRVIGVFGYSPNYVALFLAPIAVMTLAYGIAMMVKKRSWLSYVMFLVSSISLIAVYFSGSRAGLLVIAGGTAFYLILFFWDFFKKELWKKVVLALLIVAAIGTSWFAFRPDFSVSAQNGGRISSSNNIRWEIWKSSLELIKAHPILGVGLGNFQNSFGELTKDRTNFLEFITPEAFSPHNIFLAFWLSTTIFGFIAFIWLLMIFYLVGFSNLKSSVSQILLAAMTALLLQGLVDTPYFKNDLAVFFWLVFGVMIVLTKKETLPGK